MPGQDNPASESTVQDGQIVKHQSLINKTAKAMLMQIRKVDPSAGVEFFDSTQNYSIQSFLLMPEAFNNSSLVVTLPEVPSLPATSSYPVKPSL